MTGRQWSHLDISHARAVGRTFHQRRGRPRLRQAAYRMAGLGKVLVTDTLGLRRDIGETSRHFDIMPSHTACSRPKQCS